MLGTNCNENRCPGWLAVIILGISAYFLSLFLFINDAFSEVRVDITRELPDETQHIVRIFEDKEDFEMWMSMKKVKVYLRRETSYCIGEYSYWSNSEHIKLYYIKK